MDSSSFQKDLCLQAGAMSLTQKQSLSGVEALPVVEVAVKDQVRPLSVTGCAGCGGCGGMARASAWSMQADLNIKDTPLSYSPGIGRSIAFSVNNNQDEGEQPGTFTYSNLTPNWSLNWISKLSLDGSNNATVLVPGGGYEIYTNTGGGTPTYANSLLSHALLVYISSGVLQRQLPDGSIEVFNLSDGSGNIFLTEVIDPQGNTSTINYDGNFRVTSVTDANGNNSTFSYVSNTYGNSGFYLIASITDPFGRSASFAYDGTNTYLLSITDAVGIVSSFTYQTGSSTISSMTTPYGTTSFYQYIPVFTGVSNLPKGLRFSFPDGTCSVIENWIDEPKQTFFWDREAMSLYPLDPTNHVYTHCKTTRWLVDSGIESAVPNTVKMPLESSIRYSYPGESGQNDLGTSALPSSITRTITGSNTENGVVGGSITAGDQLRIVVSDASLPGGTEYPPYYTVQSGDTLSSVAANLSAILNADQQLQLVGATATASGTTVHITSTSSNSETFFYQTTSGTATETVTFAANSNLPETASLTGSVTAGDTITLTVTDSGLTGGSESVTYTVASGDSLGTIADQLAALVNADSNLQSIAVSATTSGDIVNLQSLSSQCN